MYTKMHLSQPGGHATISVKCYDRKSVALRRAHGKATTLSALSSFCFSFPTFPSLHKDTELHDLIFEFC